MADVPPPGTPAPGWAPFVVTVMVVALVAYLVWADKFEGLAGALAFSVTGYWLPVRPNRAPPA